MLNSQFGKVMLCCSQQETEVVYIKQRFLAKQQPTGCHGPAVLIAGISQQRGASNCLNITADNPFSLHVEKLGDDRDDVAKNMVSVQQKQCHYVAVQFQLLVDIYIYTYTVVWMYVSSCFGDRRRQKG